MPNKPETEMVEELRVEVGPVAASIAEMVTELVDTAERFGMDWRPTLSEFIELRLRRFSVDAALSPTKQEEEGR